jgi:superfamily II DNA/RNA helicase
MHAEKTGTPARDVTFASLGVPAPLVAVLDGTGITEPFPIQAATLPDALAGRDILGRAQTGSGKTLGFSLPLVARLAGGRTLPGRPRGLVLVPTRELATQVQTVLTPLARAMGLRVTTVYGGVSQRPQVAALSRRTDIVVACPGRLADLIGQGHCDLGDAEVTVIDEADQMADLGFLPVVRRLLEATPAGGQRLLFSATLDSAIDVLARRFLADPARHSVDENPSPAEIEHHVITIDPAHRVEVVAALAGGDKRSLVFTRTKRGAERLARQLIAAGIPAAELHGNLAQGARSRNLAAFGSGAVRVMVATDIAARGIHVDGVDLVIHADPPAEHKAYVHRSGRTARGGADGVVVTVQTTAQAREVALLMRKAGVTPRTAAADPDSQVLREIAGPPAPRGCLVTSVTELVKDRPGPGKPGPRGRREGRPEREGRPGPEGGPGPAGRVGAGKARWRRPRPEGEGRPESGNRPEGEDRAVRAAEPVRAGRLERAERPARFDRPVRAERDARVNRDWRDWPTRSERAERPARGERPRGGYARDDQARDDQARGDQARGDQARGDQARGDQARGDQARGGRRARAAGGRREWDGRQGSGDQREWDGRRGRGGWVSAGRPRGGHGEHGGHGETAPGGRPARGYGHPAEPGGRRGGATVRSGYPTVRSGYPGSRGTAGRRRNPGQGRHF